VCCAATATHCAEMVGPLATSAESWVLMINSGRDDPRRAWQPFRIQERFARQELLHVMQHSFPFCHIVAQPCINESDRLLCPWRAVLFSRHPSTALIRELEQHLHDSDMKRIICACNTCCWGPSYDHVQNTPIPGLSYGLESIPVRGPPRLVLLDADGGKYTLEIDEMTDPKLAGQFIEAVLGGSVQPMGDREEL
jgi:hypothetical protein